MHHGTIEKQGKEMKREKKKKKRGNWPGSSEQACLIKRLSSLPSLTCKLYSYDTTAACWVDILDLFSILKLTRCYYILRRSTLIYPFTTTPPFGCKHWPEMKLLS